MTSTSGPLSGIRVLDLTRVVSGPSCVRSLVELGAEVIKLEPPDGDLTRRARPRVGGIPLYYSQLNAGKLCVSADLSSAEGRVLAGDLAELCDVVVENFRPGVADRLGLGYEDVSARNVGVVYCSISGYGQTGPKRGSRAYAPVVQAEVGHLEFVARQLGRDTSQEAVSHADFAAGQQGAIGILAALFARETSGRGAHIDVSMSEAMWAINEWTSIEAAGGTDEVSIMGSHRAPVLRLADGSQAVVTGDPAGTFVIWCRIIGRPELMEDPRFESPEARSNHRPEMAALIEQWAVTVSNPDELHDILDGTGLVGGTVRTIEEAAQQPWAAHRDAFVEVGSGNETVRIPRSPIRISGFVIGDRGPSRWQGQDNRDVMVRLLGLSDSEVDTLESAGVLVSHPPA